MSCVKLLSLLYALTLAVGISEARRRIRQNAFIVLVQELFLRSTAVTRF